MQKGELWVTGWIRNGDREEAGVLIIHAVQCNTITRSERGKPQTLPVEEIFRYGQRNARTIGRKCRISHHVALKRLHEGDTGIFAAATTIRPALVLGLRLQCNAKPFDPCRIARFIEPHPRNSDARIISFCDESGKEVKLTIGPASRRRIENAFHLLRIAWLGFHYHADAF